jgi:hypothetical protein
MSKIFNSKSLATLLVVLLIILSVFILMRTCSGERLVNAYISSTDLTLGQQLLYADSTARARSWLWEFGNGDYSTERDGMYMFPDQGRYQVRLRVDNKLEKHFMVRVRPYEGNRFDHLIRINAPDTAVQGEYISFSAEGSDKEWRWEFGESGIIDSREKSAIYAYQNHGIYQVRLTTENTKYPVYHTIEVFPKYMETDSLDAATLAGNDIKQRLQNIIDGKPFNTNYNHILRTYLCNNPNILVTVNSDKRNDFYSYCKGLRIAGRFRTIIEEVYVEMNTPGSTCIDHLIILQYDRNGGPVATALPLNNTNR